MTQLPIVNPFFAARCRRKTPSSTRATPPRYARLPLAPVNASPVPHLTSLYHFDRAGEYGDRAYPGNCGGNLIMDLLRYFSPTTVFDPMTGSGTCRDVCARWASTVIPATCIRMSMRATRRSFPASVSNSPGFIRRTFGRSSTQKTRTTCRAHQPSRRSWTDTGCSLPTAPASLPGGKLAILMGDYCDRQAGFVPLTYYTKQLAFDLGLRQHCTDIIRFSHGASSSRKVYRSSFIPGLHDVCMVFERVAT